MKRVIFAVVLAALACGAWAQKPDTNRDWARLGRYAQANAALEQMPRVVLMGNSITDFWPREQLAIFDGTGIVGRGIAGQTSSEMLVRFRQDVLALQPRAVVILAGTNDVARNNGRISLENIVGNVQSMCELARYNGIEPIVCSVLPAASFYWIPEVEPVAEIRRLNELLKAYAEGAGIPFVDYYTPMADDAGALKAEYTADGVHPTAAGYAVMEQTLRPYIAKYLE